MRSSAASYTAACPYRILGGVPLTGRLVHSGLPTRDSAHTSFIMGEAPANTSIRWRLESQIALCLSRGLGGVLMGASCVHVGLSPRASAHTSFDAVYPFVPPKTTMRSLA